MICNQQGCTQAAHKPWYERIVKAWNAQGKIEDCYICILDACISLMIFSQLCGVRCASGNNIRAGHYRNAAPGKQAGCSPFHACSKCCEALPVHLLCTINVCLSQRHMYTSSSTDPTFTSAQYLSVRLCVYLLYRLDRILGKKSIMRVSQGRPKKSQWMGPRWAAPLMHAPYYLMRLHPSSMDPKAESSTARKKLIYRYVCLSALF